MRAAVQRKTMNGHVLGEREKLTPEQPLALFTMPAQAPGRMPGAIEVGVAADLCLLRCAWAKARQRPSCADVAATIRDAEVIFDSSAQANEQN